MASEARIPSSSSASEGPIGPRGADSVCSFVRNKANLLRFWAENEGQTEKQSQTKPIPSDAAPSAVRRSGFYADPGYGGRLLQKRDISLRM